MSKLQDKIQFAVKNPQWRLAEQKKYEIKLQALTPQPPAWYRIVLVAKNAAAERYLADEGTFWLHQNHNSLNATLLPEAPSKSALVFLRHNRLNSLTLRWQRPVSGEEVAEFKIKIKTISVATAWFYMLNQVSRQHAARGESRSLIYRLSRARSKRAGVDVALEKLVKEYQPMLAYQLISCEPYSYWQQRAEPALLNKMLCCDSAPQCDFAVVVKVKGDQQGLRRTLQSLLQQSHPRWRLYLCQATTFTDPALRALLAQEPRFLVPDTLTLPEAAWLLFMSEGDCLAPDALQIIASKLADNQTDVLYCDHDLLNEQQLRIAPRFKPAFSPDFLLHQNYIGPAFVVRASLLQPLASINPNWFLLHYYVLLLTALLQMAPLVRNKRVQHIALVLFHQALRNQTLGYSDNTVKQLTDLFGKWARQSGDNLLQVAKGKADNLFHIRYAIPKPWPLVSLIIPTRDALEITRTCVNSILLHTAYPHYEIIIVDNQSSEPETLAWFEQMAQHPKIRVLKYDKPFNYSAINNYAVSQAQGSVVALVNNDTEVINRQWLTEMLQHACRPDIGCVGAKLYYFDDTVQHAGVIMGLWGLAGHSHKHYFKHERGHQSRLLTVQNVSAVTAACLMVRKAVYEQVAGLNEHQLTVAFNDVDFCLKVQQAGYRNVWTPYAELYHYESKTRGKEDTPQKKAREQGEIAYMRQHWPEVIAADPYYSPNLTRIREDFSLNIDDLL